MNIQDMLLNGNGNTILMVTPVMLQEFGRSLIAEATEKLKSQKPQIFTPKEFAERHRVDVSTLWRWCKAGLLSKTIVGTKVYYRDCDLKIKEG